MAVPGGVSSGLVIGTIEAMTPAGLAYLTSPLTGSSSMTPTLGVRERVAEDAVDLEALADATVAVADAALVDAHVGQAGERGLVAEGPADGLRQPVDPGLVVVGDLGHGGPRPGHHLRRRGPALRG